MRCTRRDSSGSVTATDEPPSSNIDESVTFSAMPSGTRQEARPASSAMPKKRNVPDHQDVGGGTDRPPRSSANSPSDRPPGEHTTPPSGRSSMRTAYGMTPAA